MRLGLGTAQFGLDYGVSNLAGRTPEEEVRRVLDLAARRGVSLLDTAQGYGQSENVLGRCLAAGHGFDIVTKLPPLRSNPVSAEQVAGLSRSFEESLHRLGQDQVYGLLVHHCADLLAEGGQRIVQALQEFRQRGLARKIGVSVYGARELDAVLERWTPDIVQLPLSVLDQRLLASGHVADLARRGVEIHARSVFLQGLLLMEPRSIPQPLSRIGPVIADFQAFAAAHRCSPAQAGLRFAASVAGVQAALVGVNDAAQLQELLDYEHCGADMGAMAAFAQSEESLLNPSQWRLN